MTDRFQEQRARHGRLFCYLLVKSHLSTAMEVAKWAFADTRQRWKIEEYHGLSATHTELRSVLEASMLFTTLYAREQFELSWRVGKGSKPKA